MEVEEEEEEEEALAIDYGREERDDVKEEEKEESKGMRIEETHKVNTPMQQIAQAAN